jgi:hypothetical protein
MEDDLKIDHDFIFTWHPKYDERGLMKKPIIVSMIMALMLLVGSSFAHAQLKDPATEEKPTFYRLTPGVYVNGWPRFTVTYPKDWVERRPLVIEVFRAGTPGPALGAGFSVSAYSAPFSLDKFADMLVPFFRTVANDVTVVSDRPSQLRDGTPSRELELQMILNGAPFNWLGVAMKKGDLWLNTHVWSFNGKIGEDLKTIVYSLEFQPGKDEPVKVPPDVQEFLDRWRNAMVSHDVTKVMTYYSDRYFESGMRKGEMERLLRERIGRVTSVEVGITDFEPAGDRAYLAGFTSAYWGKVPLREVSIIKENGEWKWYGNQRDVSP